MPKIRVMSEEQIAEIKAARKKNKDKKVNSRLRALELHAAGETHEKIAEKTELATTYISELITKYLKSGLGAVAGNNYKGNRRNLSFEEETAVLEPYKKAAEAGQIIEVGEIKRAYEKAIGRTLESSRGQIYRVLKRHEWRKIMPRSEHPDKASDEEVEASKKLTKPYGKRWQILTKMAQ